MTSKVVFTRFKNGKDHWVTSGAVTSDYTFEGRTFLEGAAKPGTVAVYGCQVDSAHGPDRFISLKSNCEGKTVLRTEGWIYKAKPSGSYTPLYRCRWDVAQDHYVSTYKDCEKASGVVNEGLLEYAATA